MAGYVYLIQLASPLGGERHKAQFYLGSAGDLNKRLAQHRAGTGAAMLRAANQKGIEYQIIKSIRLPTIAAARALEKRLKRRQKNGWLAEQDWTQFK